MHFEMYIRKENTKEMRIIVTLNLLFGLETFPNAKKF
jgi:hypothetical protein